MHPACVFRMNGSATATKVYRRCSSCVHHTLYAVLYTRLTANRQRQTHRTCSMPWLCWDVNVGDGPWRGLLLFPDVPFYVYRTTVPTLVWSTCPLQSTSYTIPVPSYIRGSLSLCSCRGPRTRGLPQSTCHSFDVLKGQSTIEVHPEWPEAPHVRSYLPPRNLIGAKI